MSLNKKRDCSLEYNYQEKTPEMFMGIKLEQYVEKQLSSNSKF